MTAIVPSVRIALNVIPCTILNEQGNGIITGEILSKTNKVSEYYDNLTQLFLRFGMTRHAGAIHRAVRLPEYPLIRPDDTIHHLIVEELNKLVQCTSVADLGCGVGASLVAMSRMVGSDIHVSGITISATQAGMIRTHAVTVASFEDLPYADASLDAVWAIESFAHSQRPDLFFAEVARVLRPNGICMICDDMRTTTGTSLFVDTFVHGWMVPNIDTVDAHILRAQSHGLLVRANRDLTYGLSLYALPSSLAQRLMSFLRLIMPNTIFLRSMIGSWALQQCYAANLMSYRFVVFEKLHE